jgi:outer membrane lipoprotein carrier protein
MRSVRSGWIALAAGLAALVAAAARADGPKLDEILARIEERGREIMDFRARFRQEKTIYVLEKPLVSQGTVLFRRPGALRWETDAPEPSTLVIDETGMKVYLPRLKQLEVYDLPGKEALGALMPLFGQSAADLGRMYEVSLGSGAKDEVILELVPRSERVRRVVARIEVALAAGTLLPRRLATLDANGDAATTTFESVEPNVGLTQADMTLVVPPGTTVKKPLGGLPF